jgi:predicted DCC family thiol-disulfide oxidoreductase YuxK
MAPPILLYDGVCGLCDRLVQFILRRDHKSVFRFASLQSGLAARILARQGADPRDLDAVYIVVNHEEPDGSLLDRSDAVLFVMQQLGGLWTLLAPLLRIVPRPLRDRGYRLVARHRYQVFGRYEACVLPSPKDRDRFLDL